MQEHEYYEYFGPDYTLHVAPSNIENKNSRHMLDEIRNNHLHNLSKLQHAPSVPIQERPPYTEAPEVDEDQEDGDKRWDPDSDLDVDDNRKPIPSRVKRETVEPDTEDKVELDKKINQLTNELESANRKCKAYRTNQISVLKEMEDQKLQVPIKVKNIKISLKDNL